MYLDKMMKKVTDFTGFFEGWGSGGGEVLENLFIVRDGEKFLCICDCVYIDWIYEYKLKFYSLRSFALSFIIVVLY